MKFVGPRFASLLRSLGVPLALITLAGTFVLVVSRHNGSRAAYRFALDTPPVMPDETKALEARVAKARSPLEMTQLAHAYVARARRTGERQWLERAEELAKESLQLLSSPNSAKLVLAGVAEQRHQFADAIRWAKEAMDDRPSATAAQLVAGCALAQGQVDEALRYAELALEFRPDAGTYLWRAMALAARGRDDEADFDFERALALEEPGQLDESVRLRAFWARHLMRRGANTAARELLDVALRLAPTSALALSLRGELALDEGNAPLAAERFREAFRSGKLPRSLVFLARALKQQERVREAEETRAMAENLLRRELMTDTGHRLDLAEALLDASEPKKVEEAVKLLQEEQKVRRTPEVFLALARALERKGTPIPAQQAIREALRTGVRDRRIYAVAARLERTNGNAARARMYERLAGSVPLFGAR